MRTIAVTNITSACDLVTNGRLNNSTMKDNDLIIEAYLEDSSIGDVQDAAQEAIETGIDKDLIGGILHLPKYELDPDEIDIILNPDQNRPMN